MKVTAHRLQVWLVLFCLLTAFVGLFVFVGSSRAEGEAVTENMSLQESGMEIQIIGGYQPNSIANPTCLDNYESWPSSSHEKNNVSWSTDFMPPISTQYSVGTMDYQQFMDINGDGLLDYIYVFNKGDTLLQYSVNYSNYVGTTYTRVYVDGVEVQDKKWRYKSSCVYLNNGHGWNPAYRCMVIARSIGENKYEPVFYGDCADVENSTL
jgi:hypothetical protein